MRGQPVYTFLLVCEGSSDVRRVRAVLSTWLRQRAEWCRGYGADFVQTVGWDGGTDHLPMRRPPALARGVSRFGFGAKLGSGDGGLVRKLALLLHSRPMEACARALFVRDGDGDASREPAARAARDATRAKVAVGYGHEGSEAWVIAGFPVAVAVRAIRRPWELSHKDVDGGAKQVLVKLLEDLPGGEEACLARLVAAACGATVAPPVDGEAVRQVGMGAFIADLDAIVGPELGLTG